MPPDSISACGDCAAKVRKVLIRFHRRQRKLRNQRQRSYTSTLPEFESCVSVSTRPSSPGSGKLGVAGIGMGCLRGLGNKRRYSTHFEKSGWTTLLGSTETRLSDARAATFWLPPRRRELK